MSDLLWWYVGCRWLHFFAVMQTFGVGCFAGILAGTQKRTVLWLCYQRLFIVSAVIGLLSACAMIALQAGMMGEGWRDVLNVQTWLAVLETTFGRNWIYQPLLGAALLLVPLLSSRRRALGALILSIGLLIMLARSGHAAMFSGWRGELYRANNALHLLCAGYWAGGLYPLWCCIENYRKQQRDLDVIIRFSIWGHLAVAGVVLSGMVNALTLSALWPAGKWGMYQYGLWLKIGLVALMVGLALYNRYYLVVRLGQNRSLVLNRLARNCILALILALMVLLTVSFFATLAPQ